MKKSINQLRVELKDIAEAHLQVNSFFWGDLIDATHLQAINYPLMNAYYPNGSLNFNTSVVQIVIEVGDKLYKDSSNLNDVESDTLQIIRDVYQVINKSIRWKTFGKIQNATYNKFKWSTADEIAGHRLTINFALRDSSGVCDLPMYGYDFEGETPEFGCPSVRVINSDLSFDESVAAGDILELADITYTIRNSENTIIVNGTEVAQSNVTAVAPDITITDSDGTPIAYPSGKNFVCTPAVSCVKGGSAMSLKTGQPTSYAAGDDGATQRGRPRKTLPIIDAVQQLNFFGSKWAWTGLTGGYYDYDTSQYKDVSGTVTTRDLAFPSYIVVDHRTLSGSGDLMFFSLSSSWVGVGSLDFTTAQTAADALSVAGFNDWFVLNINESKDAFWSLDASLMPPMEAAYPNTAPTIVLASNTSFSASEIFTHWIGSGNLGTELLYPKTATNPIVTYIFGRIGNTSEL